MCGVRGEQGIRLMVSDNIYASALSDRMNGKITHKEYRLTDEYKMMYCGYMSSGYV